MINQEANASCGKHYFIQTPVKRKKQEKYDEVGDEKSDVSNKSKLTDQLRFGLVDSLIQLAQSEVSYLVNEETRKISILLIYTEDATMKQTLNRACPMAQRLALSAREFTGTLQSQPF